MTLLRFLLYTLLITAPLQAMESRESEKDQRTFKDLKRQYLQLTYLARNAAAVEKQIATARSLHERLLLLENLDPIEKEKWLKTFSEHQQVAEVQKKHLKDMGDGKLTLDHKTFNAELKARRLLTDDDEKQTF